MTSDSEAPCCSDCFNFGYVDTRVALLLFFTGVLHTSGMFVDEFCDDCRV